MKLAQTIKKSGNNVGKTTVLKLIDFCLGGDGKNIYKDNEFKAKETNKFIQNFLENNNVIITLLLKENLSIESSREIKIRRNFLSRNDKILEIDNKPLTSKEFPKELNRLILKVEQNKPTFRQLISKNIRYEKNRLQHTVKVLYPGTKQEAYEGVYFSWLGVPINTTEEKQSIYSALSVENDLQKRLNSEGHLSKIKQALIVINRNIEGLEQRKKSFALNDDYESELKQLNQIKKQISSLFAQNSRIELRKALILESKLELEKEFSKVDTEQIKFLYQEAKALMPNLQKSFEETLHFHNQMLKEKSKFIEQELPELEQGLIKNKQKLKELTTQERHFSEKLKKTSIIDALEQVIQELNKEHEHKGKIEEQQRLWEDSLKKVKLLKYQLDEINKTINTKQEIIDKRIEKFNEFFSEISRKLYDEQFILSLEKNKKAYELIVSTVGGNVGTGKKKGQIAAFDLAYIQFAEALQIECLHFILHDQIENIHDNQMSSILTDIVENINCQYILPVLKDKLPHDIDVSKYEILSLSQSSKLFKI